MSCVQNRCPTTCSIISSIVAPARSVLSPSAPVALHPSHCNARWRRVYKPPHACHPERSEGYKSHCAFSSRINVNNTTLFIFLLSVGMTSYPLCTKPLPYYLLNHQQHRGNGPEFPVTFALGPSYCYICWRRVFKPPHVCHAERSEGYNNYRFFGSSSFHSGFESVTSLSFLAREYPLICFSRAIAKSM